MTNSIYATGEYSTISDYAKNNGYSRAIGGGVTAEWGKIFYYAPGDGNRKDMMANLPASAIKKIFNYSYYYTSQVSTNSSGYHYDVGVVEGNVSINSGAYTICMK
ncbi:hypothetical protein DES39_0748 [Orbus hercynius]|uniref:Uncharacterized protein n=1 Tax=Orbus hercynius TaxID=593135 RepID=A0A495RJN1_9GAMM|nr:hypothetical protein [Orbus hercynius]RKS87514.1 hypothetical protein DES39_0748 [Orbus hercynius]